MARYQVILAYDGTDFLGFQRQEPETRTVQRETEAALRCLGWQGRTILASGRTDTGVHASGQVIAFDLDWKHPVAALERALNANLPDDIAVSRVRETSADFHPRYDARFRTYTYTIYSEPYRNPLRDRYAWHVWPPVELSLLQQAAALLPGTHDFVMMGTPPPKKDGSTVRTIYQAAWQQIQAGGMRFEITANAFLYHMVRRLVFLTVMVAGGKLSLEGLSEGLQAVQPQIPGLAPPQGLVLKSVRFKDEMDVTSEA
ncbi:MAG: tRNA pseudouridine(38-40) synthase TruA [Anaerolineaceae bacterium]|jgi:tRNA pseudouridine38-40 synthase|nr:tRNA pseudouridine(38-40) synthase TruA [Anaerolineaceae bacterium]